MNKRRFRSVLHVAVIASAIVSLGLTAMTTAQLSRSRRMMHRAASEVMNTVPNAQTQQERDAAASRERGERQDLRSRLQLRNLRLGN